MAELDLSLIPVNAVIEDRETKARFRIVSVVAALKVAYLYALSEKKWPFAMGLEDLRQGLSDQHYFFVHQIVKTIAVKEGAAQELHDARYELLKPLLTDEHFHKLLDKRSRGKLIQKHAREKKTSRQYLEKIIKQWFKNGMCFDAIAPGFHLCGSRGQKRNLGDKKVGPRRLYSDAQGINATEAVRQKMAVAADRFIGQNNGNKTTIQEEYKFLIGTYFSKIEPNESGKPTLKTDPNGPTLKQFKYFIDTHYTVSEKRKAQIGIKKYEGNERPLLGKADFDVQGPGDRFEIDATIADVYLVSQYDRRLIVGRPVIYFAVDSWSRLITGIYVGFEGPSWTGAMMVLTNIVTPKVDFCRSYGIEIDECDWPSHHLPKQILADRGELLSVRLGKGIVKNLRVQIENARPGRGDMKAIVECLFRTIPRKFFFLPGYVQDDFGERGAHDYRLDAALTLREFTQIIIYGVLAHNANGPKNLAVEPGLVAADRDNTPLERWNWGIVNRSGLLHTMSVDQVALEVMFRDRATITAHGIKFKGGYYACDELLRDEWFCIPNRLSSAAVDVSYDPRSLDWVYLRDRRLTDGYARLNLTDASIDRAGKTEFELEKLQFKAKCIEHECEPTRLAAQISTKMKAEEICDAAVARRDAERGGQRISKAEQTADIKANRQQEKLIQREKEVFRPGESGPRPNKAAELPDAEIALGGLEVLRKLRQKRAESANDEA
jgi:hypothetical protein